MLHMKSKTLIWVLVLGLLSSISTSMIARSTLDFDNYACPRKSELCIITPETADMVQITERGFPFYTQDRKADVDRNDGSALYQENSGDSLSLNDRETHADYIGVVMGNWAVYSLLIFFIALSVSKFRSRNKKCRA